MFTWIILRELLLGSVHTQAESRIHTLTHSTKQTSRQRVALCHLEKKGCQMALWEVVSEDEAGEAPSVSLREIIHVHIFSLLHKTSHYHSAGARSVKVRHCCLFRKF